MNSGSIEIHQLNKSFGSRKVIEDLDLQIEAGTFMSLMGPSGSGKSTILRILAGLESVSSGQLSLSEESLSMVFQDANLLAWRTALENVLLPFEINPCLSGVSENERKERSLKALQQVDLQDATSLFPHQLSGGMKMRVALARALVTRPRLLLLDEPFAALDEMTRFDLQMQLRNLWHQDKMTVVFVTHSITEAVFLADRIVCLAAPSAKILIDQKIDLPAERTNSLRTSAEYNHQVEMISRRLRS